jgi:hypothetical protein
MPTPGAGASVANASFTRISGGSLPLRLSGGTVYVGGNVALFTGVSDVFHSETAFAHAAPRNIEKSDGGGGGGGGVRKPIDAAVMGFNTNATATESSAGASTRKSRHVVTLATAMPAVARFMACARCKLWWMTPAWGTEVAEVPAETQFLLLELKHGAGYVALLPMISEDGFRATLSG